MKRLQNSSVDWHENNNDYEPFVKYMLGVIVGSISANFLHRVKSD